MANNAVSVNKGRANQFEVYVAKTLLDFALVVAASAEVGLVLKVQMVYC